MSSLNQVNLIGRVGRDPELRHMQNGDAVCNLSLATSEKWKDKSSGETKEATEWHRVTLYARLAEVAEKYAKKGDLIFISGKLKTRKWQDKDGKDQYTTEVHALELKLLGGKRDGDSGGGERQQRAPAPTPKPARNDDFGDDVPF